MRISLADYPRLIGVHPASEIWPANILRFHLVFDREMDPSDAARCLSIETATGEPVTAALVDLQEGLWSPDGQILTMLLHPGRIKRGLIAQAHLGLALIPKQHYRLRISGALASIDGVALGSDETISFSVGAPVESAIEPFSWEFLQPQAGQITPLRIETGRPLDALGVLSGMRIETISGHRLAATFSTEGETVIARPLLAWPNEPIRIVACDRLEDVCGNRVASSFEQSIFREQCSAGLALPYAPSTPRNAIRPRINLR